MRKPWEPFEKNGLKILERLEKLTNGTWITKIECFCGAIFTARLNDINTSHTRSCGCLQRKMSYDRAYKHGHAQRKNATYNTWVRIKGRCYNIKNKDYKDYGGRGITVSNEWTESYENFLTDMGEKPFPKAEIDRKDNSKGYSKENCRWVTHKTNMRNTRQNACIDGIPMWKFGEIGERYGIAYHTIYRRLYLSKSIEKSIEKPIRGKKINWTEFVKEVLKLRDEYYSKGKSSSGSASDSLTSGFISDESTTVSS